MRKRKIGIFILTVMCLPTTLENMLLPFICPLKSCLGEKQYCLIELSYNEEEEKLLYDYENPDTQQDRVSKYM